MLINDNYKLLLISDSHGYIDNIKNIIEKEKPIDMIIHLGDIVADALQTAEEFKDIEVKYVVGDYDCSTMEPKELVIEEQGWRIFLTHGHLYEIKKGLNRLIKRAKQLDADIVLFGDNHIQKCINHEGIIYINPGSVSESRENDDTLFSYSTLQLNKDEVLVKSCWANSKGDLLTTKFGTAEFLSQNPEWKKVFAKEKEFKEKW